jgi:prepilin-type N-terminal cleavage/methylation domain-containing protein
MFHNILSLYVANKMKQKGFTLIELLVVISIIALLASVILVAVNGARSKARDAKRAADLTQLAKAIELFNDQTGQYPTVSGAGSWAHIWQRFIKCLTTAQLDAANGCSINYNVSNYQPPITGIPEDPSFNLGQYNSSPDTYVGATYIYSNFSTGACNGALNYRLVATLENNNSNLLQNSTKGSYYNNNGFCSSSTGYCTGVGSCPDW